MAKKVKTIKEIRITDPPKALYQDIAELAKDSKRSIGKQAEYLLELQLSHRSK